MSGEAPTSPMVGGGEPSKAGRAAVVRRELHRYCLRPLLAATAVGVAFVYANGLVTRATNVHELPFKDGQSFVVVGNGPGVAKGQHYGEFIDSHDVVVRFNAVVLNPSEFTGNRTDLHIITAGSPKQHIEGAFGITVYSSWIHDKLAEFAHPFTFPLHAWGAQFNEDMGTVGPSSGLLVTKFLSEVYPNSRVSTIGMGEFSGKNMTPADLHYYAQDNGSPYDQALWKLESYAALHHNNETNLFASLRSSHRNVRTVQTQWATGARRAPHYLANDAAASNASRGDANSSLRRALRGDGYKVVSGVLSRQDVQTMRSEMLQRKREIERHPIKRFFHRIVNPTGLETVDFMHSNRAWYAATSWLSFTPAVLETKLRPYLASHFGEDVDWFFHNDIGINHLSRWHKDRLNNNLLGRYRDDYEILDPWDEEAGDYDIYKCLIYLQDHGGPQSWGPAMDVVPGTHKAAPGIGEGGVFDDLAPQDPSMIHPVEPMMGDVIIFDQRITHRGHSNRTEVDKVLSSLMPSAEDGSDARILVTVGFALRSSKHLAGFKQGTIARQRAVFFVTERMCIVLEVLLLLLGVLLTRWACTHPWNDTCSRQGLKRYLKCGSRWSRVQTGDAPPSDLTPASPLTKSQVELSCDDSEGPHVRMIA